MKTKEQETAEVEATKPENKKVQITLATLEELSLNGKLREKFKDIIGKGIKADTAIIMARREIRQLELEVK